MPVSVGTNSLDRKRNCEEQRNLADYTDSQTDMSKGADESSFATGDGSSSWHSVYSPTTVQVKYESRPGIGRYVQSLKHLLPVRVKTGPGCYMPVDMSGCCAFTFFSWLTPLVWRTLRRGLVQADLYHCSPLDSCCVNGTRFSSMWEKHSQREGLEKTHLSSQLFRFVRTRYFMSCLMYVLCVAFGFVGPTVFMRLLLEYVQKPAIDHIEGITWMLCLIACEFLRITFFALMWAINIRTAIRASSAVMSLLYRKLTKLRSVSSTSAGEIINLFANDCQKVFMMVYNAPLIIGGPLVIVGTVIYTWWLLGPFCFVGVGVFVIAYVLQCGISYLIAHFRKKAIKATDERVSLMSEFLTNIKLIKLYAWENPLMESVRDARSNERGFLEKCQYLQTLSSSVASMAAIMATIFTILAYTLFGYDLTPSEAFTLVMVNSVANHGIRTLPMCIRDIINGSVALSRLQGLMHMEDKQSYTTLTSNPEHAVYMSKATLDWEPVPTFSNIHQKEKKKGEVNLTVTDNEKVVPSDEISPDAALVTVQLDSPVPPTLVDINFILPKGKLIGVCGAVGSGKSSLISALLGQMCLLSGQVAVRGSTAYVPQQPWILNSTLKENILFGQLFSSKR